MLGKRIDKENNGKVRGFNNCERLHWSWKLKKSDKKNRCFNRTNKTKL